MLASSRKAYEREAKSTVPCRLLDEAPDKLVSLNSLGSVEIETSLLTNLSNDLHTLFDPVSDGALPIYFGPLLGRLYLEGL